MRLNQNILSPYNNFNKKDITSLAVPIPEELPTTAQPTTDADPLKLYTAEYILDYYLRNSVMPNTTADDQLHYLDYKIEATRKTISSWESYRISAVATGEEELRQKLAALQPNTGLVVNSLESASVTVNNQSYARGDIIFKDINNQQHHIPSYSGGYYYPTAIKPAIDEDDNSATEDGTETASESLDTDTSTSKGSYILSYAYEVNVPNQKNATLTKDRLDEPARTINIEITPETTSGSYGINQKISQNSGLSEPISLISNMQPVVAWYLVTDSADKTGERVYFDAEYLINDENKIDCQNMTSFSELWVEVR